MKEQEEHGRFVHFKPKSLPHRHLLFSIVMKKVGFVACLLPTEPKSNVYQDVRLTSFGFMRCPVATSINNLVFN